MSASTLTVLRAAPTLPTGTAAPQPVSVTATVETPAVYDDDAYVVVSQRDESRLKLLGLKGRDGRVGYEKEDALELPDNHQAV